MPALFRSRSRQIDKVEKQLNNRTVEQLNEEGKVETQYLASENRQKEL